MIIAIVILSIVVLACAVKVGKQADERMGELFPTE